MKHDTGMNRFLAFTASVFLLFVAPTIYGQEGEDAHERAGEATESAAETAGDAAKTGMEVAGEATRTGMSAAGGAVETGVEATGKGVGEAVGQTSGAATTGAQATADATTTGATAAVSAVETGAGAARSAGRAIAGVFGGGNNRARIRSAQEVLKEQGYYDGEIDGVVGPMTESALRKYQSEHGLEITARADEATLKSLGVVE